MCRDALVLVDGFALFRDEASEAGRDLIDTEAADLTAASWFGEIGSAGRGLSSSEIRLVSAVDFSDGAMDSDLTAFSESTSDACPIVTSDVALLLFPVPFRSGRSAIFDRDVL